MALAHAHGCVVASHDDGTREHVAEAIGDGVAIAEFPTTEEAARLSHRPEGIRVLMGAPNLVRGGSHTGNVSAEALARAGLLDILSSDYVPSSLLWAAFDLARRVPTIDLPQAVRMVTKTPAEVAGLSDRGRSPRAGEPTSCAYPRPAPFLWHGRSGARGFAWHDRDGLRGSGSVRPAVTGSARHAPAGGRSLRGGQGHADRHRPRPALRRSARAVRPPS